MIQEISWGACLLSVSGAILAARKKSICWVLWFIANLLWITYGIKTQQYAIASTDCVFLFLNIYGFCQWMKKRD